MHFHFFLYFERVESPLKDERSKKLLVDLRVSVSFDGKKSLSTHRSARSEVQVQGLENLHPDISLFSLLSPALLAFEHPTVGSMLKGRGVGAPSSMHCMKRPSLQPSARIQSAVDVAAVIRITVIKQHVNAIT